MSRSMAHSVHIAPTNLTTGLKFNPAPRGRFTLLANTNYVFVLAGKGSPYLSTTITGYTSAASANGPVITSATIQTTDHQGGVDTSASLVDDLSVIVGEWIPEGSASSVVAFTGTGWSATSGVVAALGTGVGGARWNIEGLAAYRTRLFVAVGATGGDVMVCTYEKD